MSVDGPAQKRRSSRVIGLDAARVLATFGIVWVHVAEIQGHDERLNTLGRFGTSFYILAAVFLAARGHLYRPEKRTWDVVRSRARRLLIPYALWCAIYATFYFCTMYPQGYPVSDIMRYWGPLFGTAPHLWFLPFAFVAGIFASLLVPRLVRLPGKVLVGLGVATTFASYVLVYRWLHPALDDGWILEMRLHRLGRWTEELPLVVGAIFGVAIYGRYLPAISRLGRARRKQLAALALGGFVLTEICFSLFLEELSALFWGHARFFSNLAGTFWLIAFMARRSGPLLRRLAPLGRATYFAYLSHQLILDATKRLLTFAPGYGSVWFAFASSVLIFAAASGLGLLVARVRLLRWLSP